MHGDTMVKTEPDFEFTNYYFGYEVEAMHFVGDIRDQEKGETYPQVRIYIYGTQTMVMETVFDGVWVGSIGAASIRRPDKVQMFGTLTMGKDSGSSEELEKRIAWMKTEIERTFVEDMPIYNNIRFKPNAFTEMDTVLERYLDYVRRFPKANPAANFIYD